MVIGIDIGGSTTKIVGFDGQNVCSPMMVNAGDPKTSAYGALGRFLSENHLGLGDIKRIMVTGVGSSFLTKDMYGIPTCKVDEITAAAAAICPALIMSSSSAWAQARPSSA